GVLPLEDMRHYASSDKEESRYPLASSHQHPKREPPVTSSYFQTLQHHIPVL
ncbi:hypothetical protein A2U01_0066041, partial [Trifolium medium]|nr:hypothetical protein [Trifolium medium]